MADDIGRYEDLGQFAAGGMGEVRRVRDPELKRVMVMKILKPALLERSDLRARFAEEAQVTAQLQHPGIVPIHELGTLEDGRPYFTMQEVRGRTLSEVIAEVHAAATSAWNPTESGWTLRRLIGAYRKVCDAMAFAHTRQVVHRDLKPENIMVGTFGEVQVMDWGLAKVLSEAHDPSGIATSTEPGSTSGGTIAGTPAYMAPEQARGEVDRIDPRTDVYALGAVLYEILAGRAPYEGDTSAVVLQMVLSGPPQPPDIGALPATMTFDFGAMPAGEDAESPPIPPELVAVCEKAMGRSMEDRYPDAGALGEDIGAWLDGARKREVALEVVERGRAVLHEVAALRERAASLRTDASAQLAELEAWAEIEKKKPAWALQDEAAQLDDTADEREIEAERLFHAAFTHAPELQEAHEALAALYQDQHARAEARHDDPRREAHQLRVHAAALPERAAAPHVTYLKGDGALTLVTDPPGVEVLLHRFEVQDRRLVPVFVESLGTTPLRGKRLPMGSYLCVLKAEGHQTVHYPVKIGRRAHWDGVPPGETDPAPIAVPVQGALRDHECYVPAGWFEVGGDPGAVNPLPSGRVWLDSFVVRRFPVIHAEYLPFLQDLWDTSRRKLAVRLAPQVPPGPLEIGDIYKMNRHGFTLPQAGPFSFIRKESPIFLVDWDCALRFASWYADKHGGDWQLIGDLQFEKASRGVDGRSFPWGDRVDPTWCAIHDSKTGGAPSPVDGYPGDESVYGIRGLAGNVRTWCHESFRWEGPPMEAGKVLPNDQTHDEKLGSAGVARGGYSFGDARYSRGASRDWALPYVRDFSLGIRLSRPFRA